MDIVIMAVLGCLAICAAGLLPGVTPAAAIAVWIAVLLRPLPAGRSVRLFFAASSLLLLWVSITLLPLGAGVGRVRSQQWDGVDQLTTVAREALPGLQPQDEVGEPSGPPTVARRLTLHAPGTGRWLMLVAGAWGVFWLAASLRLRARLRLLKGLVVLGTLVGVAGFVSWYVKPQGEMVCWWYPVSLIGGGHAIGPFVNRNHFAVFCALLMPLAMTIAAAPSGRPVLLIRGTSGQLEELCLSEGLFTRLLMTLCLLLLAVATLSSQSRGGTAALLVGLTAGALLWLKSGRTAGIFAGLVGVGAFLLVAFWPDAGLQNRLHGMRDAEAALGARWHVWADALLMWTQLPWAGCGMNAFRMFFLQNTTWAAGQEATHAESDVLQYVAEGGLVGVALISLVVACGFAMACKTRFAGARHLLAFGMWEDSPENSADDSQSFSGQVPYAYAVATGGALAALGLGSLVDVPLRVPLAAWTAAAIVGCSAPLPWSRRRSRTQRFLWMWPERLVMVLIPVLMLVGTCVRPGWRWLYRDRSAWLEQAESGAIVELLRDSPGYWQAWYELGDRLLAQAGDAERSGPAAREAGWMAMEQAVRCNPRNPQLRENLASRLWAAGRRQDARRHRDEQIATLADPVGPVKQWIGREWDAGCRDEARSLAAEWLERLDSRSKKVDLLQWLAGIEMRRGRLTEARKWLQRALDLEADNQRVLRSLAQCERQLGYTSREEQVLKQLVALHPDDAQAWWRLAQIAKKQGQRRQLDRALAKATRLNPKKRREADRLWKAFILEQEDGG